MSISLLPQYGTTRTTFYTTTITAPPNAKSVSIFYPQPEVTPAPEFITVTIPRLESGTESVTVLPVLVLTDVIGVIVSTDRTPLKTGTLVQPAPPQQTGWVNGNMSTPDCSAWNCWTKGQQAGTAVAIIVAALGIWAVCVWGFCWKPMKKKQKRDGGRGNEKKKVRLGFTGWTGWPFREREKDVESTSENSGSVVLPTRQSIVIQVPPRAPNGGPPAYRVVVESPPPREPKIRPAEMPPEPGPPPSRQPSGSRRTRLARDRTPEPENARVPIDHPPEMSEVPRQQQKVRVHTPRAQVDHPPPPEMPPTPEASPPQRRASQRSSYYKPRARDFAVPAAALATAGAAAAVASTKSGESSPEPRRSSRKKRSNSKNHGPPPSSYREPRREDSRRSRRREDSDREARDSSREARRKRRERDDDRERRSSRRPESRSPRPRHRDEERTRDEREQDIPRESRGMRRDSRERRGRSSSLPQTFKERSAPKKRHSNAKWLAILPFALRAIHEIAEPEGGWEQYLPGSSNEKDRRRRPRSASPDRSRSQKSTEAPKNYFTGGYTETRSKRSTSVNAPKREPSPTALKPRRSESPRTNERPQRKTSISQESRPQRSRRSTGYDGAMSTEDDDHLRLMDSDEDDDGRWSGAFERVFESEAGEPKHDLKTGGSVRE